MAKRRNFKRLVLGDIVEIPISKGKFAYAQVVYNYTKPPHWGHLLQVLHGTYARMPENLDALIARDPQFCAFYPAATALNRGWIRIVAHAELSKEHHSLPLFKARNTNFQTGKHTWWLWDGEMEWRVGELSPEHYDLPLLQLISHEVLVERIKTGWRHRDEIHDLPPMTNQGDH